MPEKKFVFEKMTLSYEGLFNLYELFQMIDTWLRKKGFDKREKRNNEFISETGKDIEVVLEPWKKVSDYINMKFKIDIHFSEVKEVIVEKDGAKIRLNKGRAVIVIDGWLETDYEGAWQSRPDYFFLRTIVDKFVYKIYNDKYEKMINDLGVEVFNEIKAFLNMHRYI